MNNTDLQNLNREVSEPGASFLSLWERTEVRVRSIATGSRCTFSGNPAAIASLMLLLFQNARQ